MAAPKTVSIKNIGVCLIRINKQDLPPDAEMEVTATEIESQSMKSMFHTKMIEFTDDPKRTREYIAEIREKAKFKPKTQKSIEELEKGSTIK